MYQTDFVRDEFLERVHTSQSCALLLDYDGTLAPFREQRDRALPYPGVPALLSSIMNHTPTRVVIVSGRPADEVVRLLGLDPCPEIWGVHGFERRLPDGTRTSGHMDRRSLHTFEKAVSWAKVEGLEHLVEQKPGAVALHWRGLAPSASDEIYRQTKKALLPLTRSSRLGIVEFDGGIELRVRNSNKGHVAKEIVREMGDVPIAYLGDDRTDEDAFRALQGRGLTVLVRPELRPTSAELWLRPPEELLLFLNDWLTATRGEQ
jgi:trehalose-phosphatase